MKVALIVLSGVSLLCSATTLVISIVIAVKSEKRPIRRFIKSAGQIV